MNLPARVLSTLEGLFETHLKLHRLGCEFYRTSGEGPESRRECITCILEQIDSHVEAFFVVGIERSDINAVLADIYSPPQDQWRCQLAVRLDELATPESPALVIFHDDNVSDRAASVKLDVERFAFPFFEQYSTLESVVRAMKAGLHFDGHVSRLDLAAGMYLLGDRNGAATQADASIRRAQQAARSAAGVAMYEQWLLRFRALCDT